MADFFDQIPEEVYVSGFSDDVEHSVEGDGSVIEALGLGEFVKFVDGFPGIWEFVADLEEEFMGKLEVAAGEGGMES